MSPVAFSFNGFEVRWYSILILVAVMISYFLITLEGKRFRINKDFLFNLIFWALILGIVGARLYYVIFNFEYYTADPVDILRVWEGGLAIHGGLIAGLFVIIYYTRKYKVNTLKILDIVVPALILSQGIGRWGNFFNSEAYGSAVSYDFLVNLKIIPQFVIDNMYINSEYHLPMFYFEFIVCIIGFIIMLIIRRRKYIKIGHLTGFYLLWYGACRFVIEMFRTDSLMIFNFKVAQVVSVVMFIAGLSIIFVQNKKPKLEDLYNSEVDDIKF